MCARSVSLAVRPLATAGRVERIVVPGVAAGVMAQAAFAAAHALLITPIWGRLAGHLPLAAACGIALAAAFDVWSVRRGSQSIVSGAQFGTLLFATLLPATAIDTSLRLAGLRRADGLETFALVTAAVLSGSGVGSALVRTRSGAAVFAGAALSLLLVSAGPLPVAQSDKGLLLSLSIAPICVAAGAVLALVRGFILRRTS